ncbi:MAG: polyprenyl synthetase family protein [Myxococcota bacterium]
MTASTDIVLSTLADTSMKAGLPDLSERLMELSAWIQADLAEVEAGLSVLGNGVDDVATKAAQHLLSRPGKRIRATAVLLSSRLGLGEREATSAQDLAIAAELVHAATLLHDDVIDLGEERRGAPAARMVYGNTASVLGGDHLLVEALRRVRSPLLEELLEVIGAMIRAEALQLARRSDLARARAESPELQRAAYLDVARGKTAALFRFAMRAGASVAKLPPETIDALGRFGESLGLAFQLVDDVLDIDGDSAITGKSVNADLREGKLTWPLIIALERDPGLGELLGREDVALDALADRIRRTEAAAATRETARQWVDRALPDLWTAPSTPARRAFEVLAREGLARRR